MSPRIGLRLFQSARTWRSSPVYRRPALGRRYETVDTSAAAQQQSLLQRLWTSPVGIRTVHFWAPVMKWALVIAGIGDFYRPPEKLSLTQNLALTATGAIWTRWCFIIKPRNLLLAAVNFFLGCVGVVQVSRILRYQQTVKHETTGQAVKEDAKDIEQQAKDATRAVTQKVESKI